METTQATQLSLTVFNYHDIKPNHILDFTDYNNESNKSRAAKDKSPSMVKPPPSTPETGQHHIQPCNRQRKNNRFTKQMSIGGLGQGPASPSPCPTTPVQDNTRQTDTCNASSPKVVEQLNGLSADKPTPQLPPQTRKKHCSSQKTPRRPKAPIIERRVVSAAADRYFSTEKAKLEVVSTSPKLGSSWENQISCSMPSAVEQPTTIAEDDTYQLSPLPLGRRSPHSSPRSPRSPLSPMAPCISRPRQPSCQLSPIPHSPDGQLPETHKKFKLPQPATLDLTGIPTFAPGGGNGSPISPAASLRCQQRSPSPARNGGGGNLARLAMRRRSAAVGTSRQHSDRRTSNFLELPSEYSTTGSPLTIFNPF